MRRSIACPELAATADGKTIAAAITTSTCFVIRWTMAGDPRAVNRP